MWYGWIFIIGGVLAGGLFLYVLFFVNKKGANQPFQVMDAQQEKLDTNAGVLKNFLSRLGIESLTRVQVAVNETKKAVVETLKQENLALDEGLKLEAAPERHERALQVETAVADSILSQHHLVRKDHQLRERLIDLALLQGLDVDTYVEITKKKRLDELEVQRLEDEAMVALRKNFVYQLGEYQKLGLIRGQLDAAYLRRFELTGPASSDLLKELNKDIRTLKRSANEARKRLLPPRQRDEVRGSDEDAQY